MSRLSRVVVRLSFVAAGLWLGGATGVALAQPLARSPFLPPDSGPAPEVAVTENAPLQFCGMLGEGEDALYNIFNPSNRRSQWVRAGQETETFTLRSFDPEAETVVVAQNGQVMTLRLEAAKRSAGPGAVAPLPMPGANNGAQNALTATVKVNPTPADEARRLEAVAAEVRRRRALRQQAAEQAAQNAAGGK